MNKDIYLDRTKRLLGDEKISSLKDKKVAVFGIGGVGSYAAEALVRSGIGSIVLIDADVVDETNINRQLFALHTNIGQDKVEAARERLFSVNPNVNIITYKIFYSEETKDSINISEFDYIIDAIDSVPSKVLLITMAKAQGVPIVSAMGAGNKLDPTAFTVADIYDTSVCPLAKKMRKLLKEAGVDSLRVVYSKEPPVSNAHPPGSIAFVPPVAGLILAGEVVTNL